MHLFRVGDANRPKLIFCPAPDRLFMSDGTLILMDEGRIEGNPVSNKIRKIRTGGQSGVDRAALDVARELNIEICGWRPEGE